MVASFLLLTVSMWAGLRLERAVDAADRPWTRLAFAWGAGQVLVTWAFYLFSWAFGFRVVTVILVLAALSVASLIDAIRNGRALWDGVGRGSWRLSPAQIFAVSLMGAAIGLSAWRTGRGDFCVAGANEDFSFHLAMVSAFLEQPFFPPNHPQFAGALLRYHFMTNFHAAIPARLGVDPIDAVQWMQVINALALGVLAGALFDTLAGSRSAAFFGIVFLLISRTTIWNLVLYHLGFPIDDLVPGSVAFGSHEYLHRVFLHNYFNFDDALSNLFHPQRPMLFGAGFGMGLLLLIRRAWIEDELRLRRWAVLSLLIGLLPLFHLHTFLVVGTLHAILVLACRREELSRRIAVLAAMLPAVFQLFFLFSVPRPDFFSGFDVAQVGGLHQVMIDDSEFWTRVFFWLRVGGIALWLGGAYAAAVVLRRRLWRPASWKTLDRAQGFLLGLLVVGTVAFLGINFYRATPNWGDSNKFYFYFTIPMTVFTGRVLGRWWRRGIPGRAVVAGILLVFSLIPYSVDACVSYRAAVVRLFRLDRSAPGQRILFHAPEFVMADWIRASTPPTAVFLTAATQEHFLPALTGRRVRCGAYVRQNGLANLDTIRDIQEIYRDPSFERLRRHPVDYILVSPREEAAVEVDRKALSRFPEAFRVEASEGTYVLYRTDLFGFEADPEARPLRDVEMTAWDSPLGPEPAWGISAATGETVFCGGNADPDALVMHAPSRAVFALEGRFRGMVGRVGIDDSQAGCDGGTVRFHVLVDGGERFVSPVVDFAGGPRRFWVDLEGGRVLELRVDDGGDGDRCDHAVWSRVFLLQSARQPPLQD